MFRVTRSPFSWSAESENYQNYTPPQSFGDEFDRDNINFVGSTNNIAEPVTGSWRRTAKRWGAVAFSIDQIDAVRANKRAKTDEDIGDRIRRPFACPFQRLNPLKHYDCSKYELKRIKDVKQHVYRCHKQPDYYCARCYSIFKTADMRDQHVRRKNCDKLEHPGFEGITEAQKKSLNKSSTRGLDSGEQWFEIWEIIFPGKKRPSAAWAGSAMEEMVQLLRRLWASKKYNILADAQKNQAGLLDYDLLDVALESIFRCLEAEAGSCL
ncbi:hypothetical protein F5883DRAFT_592572 [Diaporthe sp. PMI_573]|nr:hypothetical protein F5883DRAFT_597165 [Diaporthaceae sp. PMI_573]KAH8743595.1 hypothetical protein F5883DRAFT_592572 [Diaporthaceae sp. PMI_573]